MGRRAGGVLSYITPPVALAAVAASSIAGSNPLQTGFQAMRMGIINFILPFLFVLTPTLILRGEAGAVIHDVTTAIIAVWLMASGFEGWLYRVGRIGWAARGILVVGAVEFLLPGLLTDAAAVAILLGVYASKRLGRGEPAPA